MPTTDKEKIMSVLGHPDIWENIGGGLVDEFDPPISDNIHYLHDDGILFILHKEEKGHKIHANVIKERRGHSKEAAKQALSYAFEALNANAVYCEIPIKFTNVYRFSCQFLEDCGIIDGKHYLSLGREKWDSLATL